MAETLNIKVLVYPDDLGDIKKAEIRGRTIEAVAFRRSQLGQVRKNNEIFPEIGRPGVYILIGEENEKDQSCAYIGKGDNAYTRLSQHQADSSKEFWQHTVVFSSKDMTTSDTLYVEGCLLRAVSNKWEKTNKNNPANDAGKLAQDDLSTMDIFVAHAKTLMEVFGWDLFRETEQAHAQSAPKESLAHNQDAIFFFKGKEYDATMYIDPPSGEFIVRAGSKARVEMVESLHQSTRILRGNLEERGILELDDEGKFLIFTKDYPFRSVSAAARTVSGNNLNGRIYWKLKDGRTTYADWEVAKNDEEEQEGKPS